MQFWPRRRAEREYPRIRRWPSFKAVKPLAIGGYKAGMTHCMITDKRLNSLTKGEQIRVPSTIIECPPMVVWGVRFYKNVPEGKRALTQLTMENPKKELGRKIILPKKTKTWENIPEWDDIVLLVHTQPRRTGIGKKKPEVFEIALGGTKDEKLAYAKEKLGKEILLQDVFRDSQLVDAHAVTTGKGFSGAVKRFGVAIRHHKSEKSRRAAIIGPEGYAKVKHTVCQHGKKGYNLRTTYNLQIILVSDKPEQVNQVGGINRYGVVKNNFVLVTGSVPGPKKRFVLLTEPIRPNKHIDTKPIEITYISTQSKQ